VAHERLAFDGTDEIKITQPGYVYIYLSNENETPVEVFFDDFWVEHVKSPVVQMDDYYPFGLTFNSYSRENSVDQNYLYNSKELQDELNLGWLDYGARMYDPSIGRWMVIDPLTEISRRWTPYNYAWNNPIRYIDPDGMYSTEEWKRDNGITDDDLITVYKSGDDPKKKENVVQKAARTTITAIAEHGNKKSGGEWAKEASDQDVTAYQLFYQWVKGTGPSSRNFDAGSVMGQQMLEAPEITDAIDRAIAKAKNNDCSNTDFGRSLSEENPFRYALQDFPKDVSGRNPARGFHGSFAGVITITDVIPVEGGGVQVKMNISFTDRMTAVSGTRASGTAGGYAENPTAIYKTENPYGANGQFRTITVNYNMQIAIIR
jgi:RHS repeat-associated protein